MWRSGGDSNHFTLLGPISTETQLRNHSLNLTWQAMGKWIASAVSSVKFVAE